MDAAVRRNFSISVGGQVLTVRERRSKRDVMAAPRSGGGIGTPCNGKCGGVPSGRRGRESVHDTTLGDAG